MASPSKNVGLAASAEALDHLTTQAGSDPSAPPSQHVHGPSDQPSSTSFLSRFFPSQATIESLENRFHMGNYVMDRATGAKSFEAMSIYVRVGMHLLYYGRAQEYALHSSSVEELLKAQSVKMGAQYDDPASRDHIQPFIDSFGLQDSMKDMVQPDPTKYSNFNEFFAREMREDARPIAEPTDDLVASSPADCRLTAFPTVDQATKFWIKGEGFTVAKLLGDDALAAEFEGGSLAIARLAPQDYHRWHAPVSGTVEKPQAINEPGVVDVFCENRRSVMTVRRPESSGGGRVAIVAVGAMLVGSIRYQAGMDKPGTQMHRGQCLGAFYYGGSTVIVAFPKGEVGFDEDLVKNSTEQNCETLVQVGWRIGRKP